MFSLLARNTLSLFALVDPIGLVPLLLGAVAGVSAAQARRFVLQLSVTVALGLVLAGLFGIQVFSLLGISLGAIKAGGGLIALMAATTTVLGRATPERQDAANPTTPNPALSLVPFGVPLLVGPAALSFMMAQSYSSLQSGSLLLVIVPPVLVALLTFAVFRIALQLRERLSPAALDMIEKIVGFMLAALGIELLASGMRELFPVLGW